MIPGVTLVFSVPASFLVFGSSDQRLQRQIIPLGRLMARRNGGLLSGTGRSLSLALQLS